MQTASIAIFSRKGEYADNRSCPVTPSEIFEAAIRVMESKNPEVVRTKEGMYVIQYSPTGPTNQREGWSGWLPIYVAKIRSWSSGGIKEDEMNRYLEEKNREKDIDTFPAPAD